jgi:RepB DNA-primase from phage plasmid
MTSDCSPGLTLTTQVIRRQLAAMPYDLYRLRLIHNQTRRPLPGQRLWTPAELLLPANIRFLRIRNREGFDVFIHPDNFDQNAGYVLLDLDYPVPGVLHRMRDHGHHPCLVLQTSPGHLQAWVHVCASSLEPFLATVIARQLARLYGGDPASADWCHLGRLAGFTNQKPARRNLRGYAPWVKIVYACAGLAPQASVLVESARKSPPLQCDERSSRPSQDLAPRSALMTAAEAHRVYHDCLRRWRIAQRFPRPDWSIVDLWVVRHLLSLGWTTARVEDIIRCGSPQFPRQHGDPDDYLRRTFARAAFPFPPSRGTV